MQSRRHRRRGHRSADETVSRSARSHFSTEFQQTPPTFSLTGGQSANLGCATRLEDLDYGYIDGIEAAVRKYPLEGVKKDEADKELGYFLTNAPRMRYHWFRSRGLFVGSGVVEAGCKAVIGQRLKQSGMHWTVKGADAIITLRCAQASSQWEAICDHRHNQTPAA